MTTPHYLAMCRKKDIVEDKTLKLAKDNIQDAEELEEALGLYNDTIMPNYQEQVEKASELVAKIDESSGTFTRQNMAKILTTASNDLYKESMDAWKHFRKEPSADPEEFVNQFINSRKGYYEMQAYKEIVMQSSNA